MTEYKHWGTVQAYAEGVVAGSIVANNYRILACQRYLDNLKDLRWDFQPREAEVIIDIIENTFVHIKAEKKGQPFLLEPWELFIVYNVAGFYHAGTNERRFKETFIFISRKNGKTTFVAALAWALALRERRLASTVYIVGNVLRQALESFEIVNRNLRIMGEEEHFRVLDNNGEHSISRIFYADDGFTETGSMKIEALASNPDDQDSFNCNIAIADELHAYTDPNQYYVIRQAMKAYVNRLMFGITTAGKILNGFCYRQLKYCKKILDKTVMNEAMFVFICEADNPDDYTNPIEHEKANPSYGVTVRPEDLLSESLEAQDNPDSRAQFLVKSLNVYVNNIDSYFDIFKVQDSDEKYSWTLEELAKLPIKWYGGADLSKLHDLSGVALHGRLHHQDGDIDITIAHGFIPVTTAHVKAKEDQIPFFWWEEQGWLTMCKSDVIDYDEVVKWFIKMRGMGFEIKEVGYDRRYSREFIKKMKKAKFRIVDQPQRYVEKTEPFREIEKQINRSKFYYVHNEAYEYCIQNVHAIEDSDDFVRYSKVEPKMRIDLFDADVIATKRMMVGMEKSEKASSWHGEEE